VKDQAQKAAAERAALYVYGVRGIRNYIAVMPAHKPAEPVRIIEAISMAAS
jgi:osmotically-inducible protein OsmY